MGGFGALGSIETKQHRFVIGLRCEQPAAAAFMSDAANLSTAAALSEAASSDATLSEPARPDTVNPDATPKPADNLEVIRKFAETYAKRTGTYYLLVEVEKSPDERTVWSLAYGFR